MSTGVGIVGAGWIADKYYAAIEKTDSLRVVAACGNPTNEGFERVKQKCERWAVTPHRTYDELLGNNAVEAVAILSPTSMHYDQSLQALEAGKHILVEKPVALRTEEIQEIKRRAEKQRLVALPGHNFVYCPVVRKAREVLDRGALGTVSYASFRAIHFISEYHAKRWRRELRHSGGGAMMDSGTHLVYQSLFLLGVPECLSCYAARLHYLNMDGEDTCQISVQYPSGAIGSISQVWSAQDADANEIRIVGDEGNLKISDALYVNGDKIESDSGYESSFYHLSEAFSDAIDHNTPPLSDLDAAAKTLELIQKGYEIARGSNGWRV